MWNRTILLIALPLHLLAQTSRVPFVGCESVGQAEAVEAPQGNNKAVQVRASVAQKLAYYKASVAPGVLAPRGWHCIGVYGSSGSDLLVAPQPLKGTDVLSQTGPTVELEYISRDNGSGRFDMAQVLARVFPAQKAFVQNVIDSFDLPASEFTFGPFPNDKLIVQTDRFVEYQTPPHSEGLGTMSQLKANDDPIDGVAVLNPKTPDLLMLNARLPRELRDLAPVIIQQLLLRQRRDPR
jgi:hypothetical protein